MFIKLTSHQSGVELWINIYKIHLMWPGDNFTYINIGGGEELIYSVRESIPQILNQKEIQHILYG